MRRQVSSYVGVALVVGMLAIGGFVAPAGANVTHGLVTPAGSRAPKVTPLTCAWKHQNYDPAYQSANDEYAGEQDTPNDAALDPNYGEEGGNDVALTVFGVGSGTIDYLSDLYSDGCNDHIVYSHIWEEGFPGGYTFGAHIHVAINEYYNYLMPGPRGVIGCYGITWIRTEYWDLTNVHDSLNRESSAWYSQCTPGEGVPILGSCAAACGNPGVTVTWQSGALNHFMDNGVNGTVQPNRPQTVPYFSYFQCASGQCNPMTAEQAEFFPT